MFVTDLSIFTDILIFSQSIRLAEYGGDVNICLSCKSLEHTQFIEIKIKYFDYVIVSCNPCNHISIFVEDSVNNKDTEFVGHIKGSLVILDLEEPSQDIELTIDMESFSSFKEKLWKEYLANSIKESLRKDLRFIKDLVESQEMLDYIGKALKEKSKINRSDSRLLCLYEDLSEKEFKQHLLSSLDDLNAKVNATNISLVNIEESTNAIDSNTSEEPN